MTEKLFELVENIKNMSEQEIEVAMLPIDFGRLVQAYKHNPLVGPRYEVCKVFIQILQFIENNTGIASPVSDDDYDIIYAKFNEVEGEEIVGAINASDKNIKNHNYPLLRGTLDKIHFVTNEDKGDDARKSLEQWIQSIENKIGRKLTKDELDVNLYPKFDGLSAIFELDKDHLIDDVLTRGDTENNEAVGIGHMFDRDLFDFLKEELKPYKNKRVGIKTEVIMPLYNFKKVLEKRDYKNPRSVVSSLLNSSKPDKELVSFLSPMPLRIQELGSDDVEVIEVDLHKPVKSSLSDFNHLRKSLQEVRTSTEGKVATDGVVIVLSNKHIQEELGREKNINKFEVAFKFPAEKTTSKLKAVVFSTGKLGQITPVAVIEPVIMNGNTIEHISLGSVARFKDMNLCIGDEVEVSYEIIPYLDVKELRTEAGNIEVPTHCLWCGEELRNAPILKCVNRNCQAIVKGLIINYLQKMKIPFISIGTYDKLNKAGVLNSIEDIYRLKDNANTIIEIDGLGEKSFKKMISGIDARRQSSLPELLGSLGINSAGRTIFDSICKQTGIYSINRLDELIDKDKLCSLKGIGEIIASDIVEGLILNRSLIDFLSNELELVVPETKEYNAQVCFTNVRDKEFQKYLESKLIEVSDKVNKLTSALIVPSKDISSGKVTKAKKHNVPILTLEEAKESFGFSQ